MNFVGPHFKFTSVHLGSPYSQKINKYYSEVQKSVTTLKLKLGYKHYYSSFVMKKKKMYQLSLRLWDLTVCDSTMEDGMTGCNTSNTTCSCPIGKYLLSVDYRHYYYHNL